MIKNLQHKLISFFSNKWVNRIFILTIACITIIKVFYEEDKIEKHESKLLNLNLNNLQIPSERPSYYGIEYFNGKISRYYDNIDDPIYLQFLWTEDVDLDFAQTWADFKNEIVTTGRENIDYDSYKERLQWFKKLERIRNRCIRLYIKDQKERGTFIDAIEFGIFDGFLTNFMFYDKREKDKTLEVFGPGLVNKFYLYSSENRQINFLSSLFYSFGLLFPLYFVVNLFYWRKQNSDNLNE